MVDILLTRRTGVVMGALLSLLLLAVACSDDPRPSSYVLTPEEEEWCAEIAAGATATVEMEYTSMTADGEVKTGTQNVPVPLSMTRQLIEDRIERYESQGMKEEAERQRRLLECVPSESPGASESATPGRQAQG